MLEDAQFTEVVRSYCRWTHISLRARFGECIFSYAGLAVKNSLPAEFRYNVDLPALNIKLKALFNFASNCLFLFMISRKILIRRWFIFILYFINPCNEPVFFL